MKGRDLWLGLVFQRCTPLLNAWQIQTIVVRLELTQATNITIII